MKDEIVADRLRLAAGAGLVRAAIALPAYLLMTPFVLSRVGVDAYGIWSLTSIATGVFSLGDLGFRNGLVHYVAREFDDSRRTRGYFTAALVVSIAVAVLLVGGFILAGDALARLGGLRGADEIQQAVFVIHVSALSLALRFIATPFQALIEGRQRVHESQLIFTAWVVSNVVLTMGAVAIQGSVYALGIASVLGNALLLIAFFVRARGVLSIPLLDLGGVRRAYVMDLFRYGTGIQVGTSAIALREPILKIMIAREFGMEATAAFDVFYRLGVQYAGMIGAPMSGAFAAASAARTVSAGFVLLEPLATAILYLLVAGGLAAVAFGDSAIAVWLGSGLSIYSALFSMTIVAFSVYYATELFYSVIQASGSSGIAAMIQLASLVVTLGSFGVAPGDPVQRIGTALICGFAMFSLTNLVVMGVLLGRQFVGTYRRILTISLPIAVYYFAAVTSQAGAKVSFVLALLALLPLAWVNLKSTGVVGRLIRFRR